MQRPRTPSKLSESLHQRLNSYALAASAAGVGMLALAEPAQARIVYTHANIYIPVMNYHRVYLDINHDGINDFYFFNTYTHLTSSYGLKAGYGRLGVVRNASTGNLIKIASSKINCQFGEKCAAALSAGVEVGPQSYLFRGWGPMAGVFFGSRGTVRFLGPWNGVTKKYLGVEFMIAGKPHHGWVRLNASCGLGGCPSHVTGYAYETIPGKSIITGKTHGKDVVTIEPASLGALARGASAIPAWRKGGSQ